MRHIIHIQLSEQINDVVESIKEARITGRPIQFIVTKDLAIIDDIISNPRIISQRDRYVTNKTIPSNLQYSLGFANTPTNEGWKTNNIISKPTIFLLRLTDTEITSQDYQNVIKELHKFVQIYSGAVRSQVVNSETKKAQELFPCILESSVVICCPNVPQLPPYISLYSKIIRIKTPEGEKLKSLLKNLVREYDNIELDMQDQSAVEYFKEMERQLRGLSQTKIEQIFAVIKNRLQQVYFDFNAAQSVSNRNNVKNVIQKEKQAFVESSDVLKLVDYEDAQEPAGLSELVNWLKDNKRKIIYYNEERQTRAASMPKGILMSGIPGSGKSMTARYVAKTLSLPLLKLDFGDLLDKWQGSSEHRMQSALDAAIEMAPCVLWVDEIEKAFSGAKSDNEASSKRMISKFLTWMQDKEKENACCFVFATANSIIGMPPELFRSGRFDAKFYTFLPSYSDCISIFEKTLNFQNNEVKESNSGNELFDVAALTDFFRRLLNDDKILRRTIENNEYTQWNSANKFFTGSDITSLIEVAKDKCFKKNNEPEEFKGADGEKYLRIYSTRAFREALSEALSEAKTYGETNFRDCAETFSQICYTNFIPASKPILLTDSVYYDESTLPDSGTLDLSMRENRVYDMGEKAEFIVNEYDKQMYYMIRNCINQNIRQFIYRRERR